MAVATLAAEGRGREVRARDSGRDSGDAGDGGGRAGEPGERRTSLQERVHAVRTWLRVPRRFPLPAWAAGRLFDGARALARAREGIPLEEVVFGVVDLETTGVSVWRHRILEIGLVVQRAGRTQQRFSTLVDPGAPIPPLITALTGIQQADLRGAPREEEALASLERALGDAGVSLLVAHNASFDRRFLERAWRAEAGALPPFLCSLRLARRLIDAPRYALDVLAGQLAIPVRDRHRALGDAEMTAALWWELLSRARVQAGVHTVEGLRELAEPARGRPRRPRRRVVDAPAAIG